MSICLMYKRFHSDFVSCQELFLFAASPKIPAIKPWWKRSFGEASFGLLLVVDAHSGIFRNSDIFSWLENYGYKQSLDILKC